MLYDAAIRHLRKSGFRTAILSVLEGNHRARSWYERLGWQPTPARIPVYQPAGIEDIVFIGNTVPPLGGVFGGSFCAAMADGSARFVRSDRPENVLRALITATGGELIDLNWDK